MNGLKLETLKEKKDSLSKSTWKKLLASWSKDYKITGASGTLERLEELLDASKRMKEWSVILEAAFQKKSNQDTSKQIDRFLGALNETVIHETFAQLFSELSKKGRQTELKVRITRILSELKPGREQRIKKTLKAVSEFNSRRAAASLLSDYCSENFFDITAFAKFLDTNREKLFNHVVEVIRAGRRDGLGFLQAEVEKFSYGLEIAVASGFEKGKKLLHVLQVLNLRLKAVENEERFREFVQDLESECSTQSERVSDIIWLREIRNHLGLKQANTLQEFHAHIPASLQVLKRRLVWK